MKISLKIFFVTTTLLISSLNITACTFNNNDNQTIPIPPMPPIYDQQYWTNFKVNMQNYFNDCQKMLRAIHNNKDQYDSENDYQCAVDEVRAESNHYQALINNCDYQILLLDNDGILVATTKTKAITILQAEINNLQQELICKQKYPNHYSQIAIQLIMKAINDTKITLNNLLKP